MRVALALVLVVAATLATAQIRPHISETFEGEGYTHIVTANGTLWGLGRWVIDEPAGLGLEDWDFPEEHRHHNVHFLQRYDLGFDYALSFHRYPSPHAECHKRAVKPPMPPLWAWVREAHYRGKHVIDGTTYDLWGHHFGGVELEVAVSEHDASRPHYFHRRSPSEHRTTHLISFAHFKPNATWFTVPEACKNATETISVAAPTCQVAATQAETVVMSSNGFGAAAMIANAFSKAAITVPATLEAMRAEGAACVNGPRAGDVFFDASSASVYLGGNRFAECPAQMGGACAIVPQRDFIGGCRRFC